MAAPCVGPSTKISRESPDDHGGIISARNGAHGGALSRYYERSEVPRILCWHMSLYKTHGRGRSPFVRAYTPSFATRSLPRYTFSLWTDDLLEAAISSVRRRAQRNKSKNTLWDDPQIMMAGRLLAVLLSLTTLLLGSTIAEKTSYPLFTEDIVHKLSYNSRSLSEPLENFIPDLGSQSLANATAQTNSTRQHGGRYKRWYSVPTDAEAGSATVESNRRPWPKLESCPGTNTLTSEGQSQRWTRYCFVSKRTRRALLPILYKAIAKLYPAMRYSTWSI